MELNFLTYLRGMYNPSLGTSNYAHYAVIQSIYDEFVTAEGDINKARLEMSLETATGYWLDCWGDLFHVPRYIRTEYETPAYIPRQVPEEDEDYRARILRTVTCPRVTVAGLKQLVAERLNFWYPDAGYDEDDVIIREMFRYIARYSENACLSGNEDNDETRVARFSSNTYSYGRLIVVIPNIGNIYDDSDNPAEQEWSVVTPPIRPAGRQARDIFSVVTSNTAAGIWVSLEKGTITKED